LPSWRLFIPALFHPIYRVTGTIIFKKEDQSGGGKFDNIFNAKNVSDVQSEIEILKSQALMERVVDSVQLQASYFAVGKIKTLNIYTDCPFRLNIIKLTDSFSSFKMNFTFPTENEFKVNKESERFKFGMFLEILMDSFRLPRHIMV
jgi:hypothetical protein